MSKSVENSSPTQDSADESIDINNSQTFEFDHQKSQLATSEVTHQSVSARFKLVVEPTLRQIEKLYALILEKNMLDPAGNSKASGLRRNEVSTCCTDNRYVRSFSPTGIQEISAEQF